MSVTDSADGAGCDRVPSADLPIYLGIPRITADFKRDTALNSRISEGADSRCGLPNLVILEGVGILSAFRKSVKLQTTVQEHGKE